MSVSPDPTHAMPPATTANDAERSVFALLALLQDPDRFAARLGQFTDLKEEAARRLAEADERDRELAAREHEVQDLKSQTEETLAVYRRELEDLARKREEAERLQSDLFEARAKMESDAAQARRAVDAKAAELKKVTDGIEERERLAAQVFDQGTALQREYKDKLAQLKHITAG